MTLRRQKLRPREAFPAPPSPGIYKKIAYSFVALTLLVVFAALWFSSVRATVSVRVTREPTQVSADVSVARAPGEDQLAGRVVQGVFEKIQEFGVQEGQGKSVEGTSKGTVRLYNTSGSDQPLVKTTRLLTSDGRLYHISDGVTVPAKGTVDVDAYADAPGKSFDFDQKKKMTVPGLSESRQQSVYAENITAFTGGESLVRVLTKADIDAAGKVLEDAILAQARQALQAEVSDGRFTEAVYVVKRTEEKTDVQVGEEANSFLMSMKLDVTGVYYNKTDLQALVREKVQSKVPEGRVIASRDPTRMDFSVESADAGSEMATIRVTAEILTKITDTSIISKDDIVGLPVLDAERLLEQKNGIEKATITVRPGWVRRLPTLHDHITIKLE